MRPIGNTAAFDAGAKTVWVSGSYAAPGQLVPPLAVPTTTTLLKLEALPGVKLITRFVVPKPGKVKGVPETIANGPLLIEAVPLVSGVATRLESTKLL